MQCHNKITNKSEILLLVSIFLENTKENFILKSKQPDLYLLKYQDPRNIVYLAGPETFT